MDATNNQSELYAAWLALLSLPADAKGVIRTDSRYIVDGINTYRKDWKRRGWRKSDGTQVKNMTLWQALSDAADDTPGVRFEWVQGHSGDAGNALADRLARTEAEKVQAGLEPVGAFGGVLEDFATEDTADEFKQFFGAEAA